MNSREKSATPEKMNKFQTLIAERKAQAKAQKPEKTPIISNNDKKAERLIRKEQPTSVTRSQARKIAVLRMKALNVKYDTYQDE